jgi:hypothetical protein
MRVSENGVLRRIFGAYEGEVTGGWRKLHNEKLHNFYSPNIIRIIKPKRIKRAEHAVRQVIQNCGRKTRMKQTTWEKIILKWIFKKYVRVRNGFIWLRIWTSGWLL